MSCGESILFPGLEEFEFFFGIFLAATCLAIRRTIIGEVFRQIFTTFSAVVGESFRLHFALWAWTLVHKGLHGDCGVFFSMSIYIAGLAKHPRMG